MTYEYDEMRKILNHFLIDVVLAVAVVLSLTP